MRRIVVGLSISLLVCIVGCGSGSHSTTSTSASGGNPIAAAGANNVAPLLVDSGPYGITSNVSYTTVVVCAPGTSNCATFDHISVDTGSTGLRIPSNATPASGNWASVLAAMQNVNPAAPLAECVQFLDNTFLWGSVKSADVKMGGPTNTGEVAASVPIHVVGDSAFPTVPSNCTGTAQDTAQALGEDGRLGVGNLQYDCDALGFSNACTSSETAPTSDIIYYACSGSSCSDSPTPPAVPLNQQIRNPVSLFAKDNNGVILEMPPVAPGGQSGVSANQAALVFGIGTQSNNGLGSATILAIDSNPNNDDWSGITTVFNGHPYPGTSVVGFGSFLDSGSNGIFFLDQSTSGIPDCTSINVDFYCPTSTLNLTAENQSVNGNNSTVQFTVFDAAMLVSGSSAFSGLAGPNALGASLSPAQEAADGYFDWGLPFFYGRNVYTAISGVTPPSGVQAGPFWAY